MNLYEQEILDNLADAIKADITVAMTCPIIESHEFVGDLSDSLSTALASIGVDKPVQSDLYYLNSILVSAGWNKNDDVFTVEDLWEAKDTPVDKPFNYMHDETDIIGHMTASAVIGPDGKIIGAKECLADKVDIITSAVIYKSWSDPEQKEKVQSLIEQVKQGLLSVSMETIFTNFDYAIITPDGEHKVLARSQDSAFLTKHLRCYGGDGEYKGYKVGRLLRGFYFTGKGLVDKPANPRSIIFKDSDPFKPSVANITFFTTAKTEINMELEQLKADLDSAKAEIETFKTQATDLTSAVAEKETTIVALEVKVKELEDAIASISTEKVTLSEELQKMVSEARLMKRRIACKDAGADDAKAEELVTTFSAASDEMFASVVALIVPKVEPVEVVAEVTETEVVVVETEVLDDVEV